MATLTLSALAPADAKHFSLGQAELDISGSYETTDAKIIGDALVHPWIDVKFPEVKPFVSLLVGQIKPEDDAFSQVNDHSNDPEVAAAAEAAKESSNIHPVAIDAGEDQGESQISGGVAETLAGAAEAQDVQPEGAVEVPEPVVTPKASPKSTKTTEEKI